MTWLTAARVGVGELILLLLIVLTTPVAAHAAPPPEPPCQPGVNIEVSGVRPDATVEVRVPGWQAITRVAGANGSVTITIPDTGEYSVYVDGEPFDPNKVAGATSVPSQRQPNSPVPSTGPVPDGLLDLLPAQGAPEGTLPGLKQ